VKGRISGEAVSEFDFRWNSRHMSDGNGPRWRSCPGEGKRLYYKKPIASEPPHDGEQLTFWEDYHHGCGGCGFVPGNGP